MLPEHDIASLLEDLYAIEPELKHHDSALREAITKLIAEKPKTEINPAFMEQLKKTLLERADVILATKPSFFERISHMQKTFLIPAGAAAVLVLAATVGVMNFLNQPQLASNDENTPLAIVTTGNNAFGSLIASREAGKGGGIGLGGGGGNPAISFDSTAPATQVPAPTSEGAAVGSDSRLVAPGWIPTNYTYVYAGNPLVLTDEKLPVLRRNRGINAQGISAALESIRSFMNVDKLSNVKAQNMFFNEDRDFGYGIGVDFIDGSITFSQNWQKWPHPEQECRDEACYRRYRLSEADMLSDDQMITIADRFLADYGIDRSGYGSPEVRNDWRIGYAQMPVKEEYYFPESIQVVYPQIVNGQKVYDEGGNPTGLSVNVNIRHKRVDNAYGITGKSFQSSNYDMETNGQRIIDLATKGGYSYTDPAALYAKDVEVKNVTLQIGTPERILMKIWRWDGAYNEELLVPGLRFPILNPPADQPYFQTNISIPLAKELIDQRYNGGGYGGPIMPLIVEDAKTNSAGVSTP